MDNTLLPPAEPRPVVLVIEDEPGDALLITRQLRASGSGAFEVHLADSLAAAERLIVGEGLAPQVVLLDLNLPDSIGVATVARCRQLIEAPIVVLTGLDDSAANQAAIASGAEDYLAKGGDGAALRKAIRYAMLRYQRDADTRLAATVFSHAREGIMITTADGTIIDVNDAFSQITGYRRDEVLGRNPRMLSSGRQEPAFYAELWRTLIAQGHWFGEVWNRRKDDAVYAVLETISAVRDAQGNTRQYVALFSDITLIKEHERELERIAHYDTLTGLPNRVRLADRLHQAMAQAQRHGRPLAVALVDLDDFKAINDQHGHAVGDHLLITVAAGMQQVLRDGDTLARIGGDEFVAVLLDLPDIASSGSLLARLLAAAAEPVAVGNHLLRVSASIGVTFYPQADELDAEQLLRQADQAMYQAKLIGKGCYKIFDAVLDRHLRDRHERVEHIRRALSADEFVLYYQPQVNMRTGTVIGAEALIRWQHPQHGLLLPAQFLPAIADHPLAVAIGDWVIATALDDLRRWQAAGLLVPVSINVAARQLLEAGFVQRLQAQLAARPQIRACDTVLEVQEIHALADLGPIAQVIDACRQLGMGFALDDFGTGYGSLTYLKRLPVTQIKIDQRFVRGMLEDPDDLAILDGVFGLANAFGRQVIAEGVERIEHGELLLQLGCDLAQGYGIAHPMPAADLPAWAAAWRPAPAWAALTAMRTPRARPPAGGAGKAG